MTLPDQYAALVAYLRMKVEQRDWHGVSDAANDLREMEARHGELREGLESVRLRVRESMLKALASVGKKRKRGKG